jgi:hypothetical protein
MPKFIEGADEVAGLSEYSGDPLTENEVRRVRRLLEAESRMKWFWSTVWVWSRAILITLGSVFFLKNWIGDLFAWLSKLLAH